MMEMGIEGRLSADIELEPAAQAAGQLRQAVKSVLLRLGAVYNNAPVESGALADVGDEWRNKVRHAIVCQSGKADGEVFPPGAVAAQSHPSSGCRHHRGHPGAQVRRALLFYKLSVSAPVEQMLNESAEEGESEEEAAVGCQHWQLPHVDFDRLWETLIYSDIIKSELLNFVQTILAVSDSGADSAILSVNRLMLLHGPPGTGKTSLCRALAQRLSIRLKARYSRTIFVEVNSHSLFSKLFSESGKLVSRGGKLVSRMFGQISQLLDNADTLVAVLIDEPSDAVRVVNAVLTQVDALRRRSNALVLTTSNLSAAVDSAFVDRADVVRRVPPPDAPAIYTILLSALRELQRVGLVDCSFSLAHDCRRMQLSSSGDALALNHRLFELAQRSQALSDRSLRKLPVVAYAYFEPNSVVSVEQYLNALGKAIEDRSSNATLST